MIKVIQPSFFKPELKYTLGVLLKDFLGLKVEYSFDPSSDLVRIELENGKKLELAATFFSNLKTTQEYLNVANIPSNTFDVNVFGQTIRSFSKVDDSIKKEGEISLGIDVLGPTFFMLSRWEEYVNTTRDKHDRFPGKESLAQKEGFHQRPIVNEYVELIWSCLHDLGIQEKRKTRSYEPVLTCDVDYIQKFYRPINLIRALGGDIVIRKNPFLWFRTTIDFINSKISIKNDPFYTFDYFMDLAEEIGVKFHFYFMPLNLGDFDARYNFTDAKDIINTILDREHIVGMHPGYNSYNNAERFKEESEKLKTLYPLPKYGRQHYLRIKTPETLSYWEENGFEFDSTYGYENDIGFRCGVCYEFPVFDFKLSKKLNLTELPLHFMEVAYFERYGCNNSLSNEVYNLVEQVKNFNGKFVLLWHNNNVYDGNLKHAKSNFEELMKLVKK